MTTKDIVDLGLYRNWLRDLGLYDTMDIVMPEYAVMHHWDGIHYAIYVGRRVKTYAYGY